MYSSAVQEVDGDGDGVVDGVVDGVELPTAKFPWPTGWLSGTREQAADDGTKSIVVDLALGSGSGCPKEQSGCSPTHITGTSSY